MAPCEAKLSVFHPESLGINFMAIMNLANGMGLLYLSDRWEESEKSCCALSALAVASSSPAPEGAAGGSAELMRSPTGAADGSRAGLPCAADTVSLKAFMFIRKIMTIRGCDVRPTNNNLL